MPSSEIIDALLNPKPENAEKWLREMKLDRPTTKEDLFKEIEDEFLTPRLTPLKDQPIENV